MSISSILVGVGSFLLWLVAVFLILGLIQGTANKHGYSDEVVNQMVGAGLVAITGATLLSIGLYL